METNFVRTFVSSSLDEVLAPSTVFSLELTQIINRTAPLSSDDSSNYSGIWLSTFKVEEDQLFHEENRYKSYKRIYTNISVTIDQSLFYVSNVQEPIARQREIIFHSLLFTNVVLELFGLLFLVTKLILIPAIQKIIQFIKYRSNKNQVIIIKEDLNKVVVLVDKENTLKNIKPTTIIKSHPSTLSKINYGKK